MPFGYLDTQYIDFPPGIDEQYLRGLSSRAGVSFADLLETLDERLQAFNGVVDPLVASLISVTTQAEADTFSGQLRARGHKAYVVEAKVPGRGTWYRVRIGPFTSQHAAASYRAGFEGREHVVPFIVPPSK